MKKSSTAEKLLTIEEAADILQVHRETVKDYIQQEKIKAVKIGYRTVRISPRELNNFIKSCNSEVT